MSKFEMFREDELGMLREEFLRKQIIYSIKIEDNMFDLVHKGNYEVVYSKVKEGISVNLRNDQDQTLLHYAVLYNQVKIAKLLITLGADLYAKDKFGQTALEVIQKHNPELYSKTEYTRDSLQLQERKTEIIESDVIGASSEDNSCCIIF
jgi:hypothetical protein